MGGWLGGDGVAAGGSRWNGGEGVGALGWVTDSLGWVEEASSNEKVVVNVEGKTRGGAGGEAQVEWS